MRTRFLIGFHEMIVQRASTIDLFAQAGVLRGNAEHVLEMAQEGGRRLRVFGVAQVVGHSDA